MSRSLYFFTLNYPYGQQETFIENEIDILAQYFDHIFLLPLSDKGKESVRTLPPQVEVVPVGLGYFESHNMPQNFGHLLNQVGIVLDAFIKGDINLQQARTSRKLLERPMFFADKLQKWFEQYPPSARSVFYSYWFSDWATILSLLVRRGVIESFISRTHRYDLYPENNRFGFMPHRRLQLKSVRRVYAVSQLGATFLKEAYPTFSHKIQTSYLGVRDHGPGFLPKPEQPLHIVSIANLVAVKRVHLIAMMLPFLGRSVQWTHFGDGPEKERVQSILSQNLPEVQVNWMGRRSNHDVLSFLKKTPIHIVLNVSSSEGLPVSLMEAISFGIPVIATDVGGTREIVNDLTGRLLPSNIEAENLAKLILQFCRSHHYTDESRTSIRRFWEKWFNADVNYHFFAKSIDLDGALSDVKPL